MFPCLSPSPISVGTHHRNTTENHSFCIILGGGHISSINQRRLDLMALSSTAPGSNLTVGAADYCCEVAAFLFMAGRGLDLSPFDSSVFGCCPQIVMEMWLSHTFLQQIFLQKRAYFFLFEFLCHFVLVQEFSLLRHLEKSVTHPEATFFNISSPHMDGCSLTPSSTLLFPAVCG